MRSDEESIAFISRLLQCVEDFNSLEDFCIALVRHFIELCLKELDDYLFKNKPKGYNCDGFKVWVFQTKFGDISLAVGIMLKRPRRKSENRKGVFAG